MGVKNVEICASGGRDKQIFQLFFVQLLASAVFLRKTPNRKIFLSFFRKKTGARICKNVGKILRILKASFQLARKQRIQKQNQRFFWKKVRAWL